MLSAPFPPFPPVQDLPAVGHAVADVKVNAVGRPWAWLRFMTPMGTSRYRIPGVARMKKRAAPVPKAARLADRPVIRPESGRRTRKKKIAAEPAVR
jgi:hypothetical protein